MKKILHQLDKPLQFRLCRLKKAKDFFIVEINDRAKMSKPPNKYITALDYADKTLLVLQDARSDASFAHLLLSLVHLLGHRVPVFLISNYSSVSYQ